LFCENKLSLLPTVTSVEPPGVIGTAPAGTVGTRIVMAAAAAAIASRLVRMNTPHAFVWSGLLGVPLTRRPTTLRGDDHQVRGTAAPTFPPKDVSNQL
jgi:hypothetical protein